jgi:hypothetical protein
MQVDILKWCELLVMCLKAISDYSAVSPRNMGYTREQLLDIVDCLPALPKLSFDALRSIRHHGINEINPTIRGCRAGKHIQRSIASVPPLLRVSRNQCGINSTNLTEIHCIKNDHSLSGSRLSFGLINARSIKNKTTSLVDYITDNDIDVIAITETWLGTDGRDRVVEGEVCPPGYNLLHVPRPHGKGGGVAVLYKANLNITKTV